ncbi:MAG: DUF2249 domain-containing protein [Proteobacteria bacterium]|nr:DUF2249 domain-containing protein [Pseudomonadota bacterium]
MATYELDVRPTLRAGGEPFGEIMARTGAMTAGQSLRLLATFEPKPLFHVLGSQGFTHEAREIGGGDWEVTFTKTAAKTAAPAATAPDTRGPWPKPVQSLDNRGLEPPEPMVRTLAEIEKMKQGEVIEALLEREPVFLYRELAKRGHSWKGDFDGDGKTFRLLVRKGAQEAA